MQNENTIQPPPQDLDAERALLGAMMTGGESVIDEVLPVVNSREAFYLDTHAIMFEILVQMHAEKKRIDYNVFVDEARKAGKFDRINLDYLFQTIESFGDWTRAAAYAEIVKEKYALRNLIRIGTELALRANSHTADATELAQAYADKIEKARAGNLRIKIESVESLLWRTAESLAHKTESRFIPTGFLRWDQNVGGLERPALIIGGARPSAGKTSLGLRLMVEALRGGVQALFISLEMTVDSIGERLLTMQTGIPLDEYRKSMTETEIRYQASLAVGELRDRGGHIVGAMKVAEMLSLCRLMARKGVGIVFIDFLQLCVGSGGKGENRNQVIGSITRAFKVLAMEMGITVVMLSQLGRDSAHNDREPTMTDLRDSGEIEQDADVIFLLSRREADADLPVVPTLLKIAKNRNGPLLRSPMRFTRKIMRFDESSQ